MHGLLMIIDLLLCMISDLLHANPNRRKSASVDKGRDLIASHHSEFIVFARNDLSFPTDGAKLLEQFSV
jgi:hypothetical protein